MQLYNYDNWFLEGVGIVMTIVTLFTTSFFLASILNKNDKKAILKYFIVQVIAYFICRINITLYGYRADILALSMFVSCFIFSKEKWYKKLLLPIFWIVLNTVINASLNLLMMEKYNLTTEQFGTLPYEEVLQIVSQGVYATFCLQGFGYTAVTFIEMMILVFINRKDMISKEIILINLFALILTGVTNIPMYFMGENKIMVVSGCISFIASVFLMIYSYSKIKFYQDYNRIEIENNFLKEQENMRLDYYNDMKIKEEKIRMINHDIKNNLSIMYNMDDEVSRRKLVDTIDRSIKKYELIKYSSNDILNIILNTKVSKAIDLGIKIEVNTKSNIDFLEDIDISNLFSNILDNAIEGSSKAKHKEISFKMYTKFDNVIIECSNNYDGKVIKENSKFKSSKNSEHGYGTRIINDIVKKYNGECNIEYDDKIFSVMIMIPKSK